MPSSSSSSSSLSSSRSSSSRSSSSSSSSRSSASSVSSLSSSSSGPPSSYLTCSLPPATAPVPLGAGDAAVLPNPTGCGCQKSQPTLLPLNYLCYLTDQPYTPRESPPGQLAIPASTAAPGTAAAARDAANPLSVADAMSQLLQGSYSGGGFQGCSSAEAPCHVDPVKGSLIAHIRTPPRRGRPTPGRC